MNENIAGLIAEDLLNIEAVSFSTNPPYTWASGILSPIYTDNRLTIAYPRVRGDIADGLSRIIEENFPEAQVIGGVATAGIPHATLVSDVLNKPLIYVRSKPKDHGQGKQTEGRLEKGDKVVLIDDLISTGGSVLKAAEAVRAEGVEVIGVAAIFSYQLPDAVKNFADAGIPLVTLTNFDHMIKQAVAKGYLDESEVDSVSTWKNDPWAWDK